ncbi:MAG: universal stress protein [Gemmatimonadaceae bacterium]
MLDVADVISNGQGLPTCTDSLAIFDPSHELGADFPLLLALANDESSVAAIQMTEALARTRGAVPTVVRALGNVRAAEASASPIAGRVAEESLDADHVNACRAMVAEQLASVATEVEWPLAVTNETPIDAIVGLAKAHRAGMIVMGLRRHGVLRRSLTRELLSEVLRRTRVPVLAVRPELQRLPRRIVVAVDFGGASIRAVRVARRLLADGGSLCVVHVTPHQSDSVREKLDRILDDLGAAPGMTMSSVILHGDVQSSIEGCAQAMDADLLAVGSETHSLLDAMTRSRMPMKLAHSARWSMLIVPAHGNG